MTKHATEAQKKLAAAVEEARLAAHKAVEVAEDALRAAKFTEVVEVQEYTGRLRFITESVKQAEASARAVKVAAAKVEQIAYAVIGVVYENKELNP